MKLLLLYFSFALSLLAPSALLADDAELLAGKWSVNKTEQGQKITQTIEIKKDKFIFEILNEGQAVLHAEGDVKFEKLGPLVPSTFPYPRRGIRLQPPGRGRRTYQHLPH